MILAMWFYKTKTKDPGPMNFMAKKAYLRVCFFHLEVLPNKVVQSLNSPFFPLLTGFSPYKGRAERRVQGLDYPTRVIVQFTLRMFNAMKVVSVIYIFGCF